MIDQRIVDTFNRLTRAYSRVRFNPNACWLWPRRRTRQGYGMLGLRMDGRYHQFLAHRVAYEILKGPIPEDMELDHTCRTRACYNPAHLEPVTGAENTQRSRAAKLTAEQVQDIRNLLDGGGLTQKEVGLIYGVHQSNISAINTRRSWKNLP